MRVQGKSGWKVLLVGLWVVVYFAAFAGRTKIVIDHEARVVETAQAMVHAGWPWGARRVEVEVEGEEKIAVNPWVVPVFRGEVRLQKPPLPYWVTAGMFAVFGETAWAARAVPAILAAGAAGLILALVRLTPGGGASRVTALIAVAVWVSTFFLLDESRKAMVDPYLAVFTLAAVTGYAWGVRGKSGRSRGWALVCVTAAVALGALSKGPVVLLHVGVGVAAWSFATRKWARVSWWWVVAMVGFAAVVLPWPLAVMRQVPDALALWRHESIGEFGENTRNARPWYFYSAALPYLPLPWTVFTAVGVVTAIRRRSVAGRFALVWVAASVVVFSFAHMKKNAYLLPVMPAFVMLTAVGIAQGLVWAWRFSRRRLALAQVLFGHMLVGVGAVVAMGVMLGKYHRLPGEWPVLVVAGIASVMPVVAIWRRELRRAVFLQAAAFSVIVFLFVSFPGADHDNRRRALALTDESPTQNVRGKNNTTGSELPVVR